MMIYIQYFSDNSTNKIVQNDSHPPSPVEYSRQGKTSGEYLAEADHLIKQHSNLESASSSYTYTPQQLNLLVDPKNGYVLHQLGGAQGLAAALHTDLDKGLSNAQISDNTHESRVDTYGLNRLPEKTGKGLLKLMWMALQDKVLIILSIAAVISLALGLYETFGQPTEYDSEGRPMPKVDWVEGVAIIVAVIIVVIVGAGNDYQKERQFARLNRKKEDRQVKIIRDGAPHLVSVFDILVGDLEMVEPGEMIPVDGVLISGYDVKCDESAASGESETMKKSTATQVVQQIDQETGLIPHSNKLDAFMLSGSKVLEGTGVFLVTSVGENSLHGRTMMSLQDDVEATPLQEKLNSMAESIAKFGLAAALVLFFSLFIRFLVELHTEPNRSSSVKGEAFMQIFIVAVTIVVVAVPEGLPLAVTLALAFATTRMVKDNNLVRVLKSCETMGGATTICSDKTGTLTQNKMSVVAGTLGSSIKFSLNVDENRNEEPSSDNNISSSPEKALEMLGENDRTILLRSIALNSSAFEADTSDTSDKDAFVGSKTETALLDFAKHFLNMGSLEDYRHAHHIVQVYPFDSTKKFMATIIKLQDNKYRLYVKGASEVVLDKCSNIVDNGHVRPMATQDQDLLRNRIDEYASNSLRTIGIIYKDFDTWSHDYCEKLLYSDMTFLGVFGIQDPLRPGVKTAVKECQDAGVVVRMVTGDNINTAKAIAIDCGIISSEEVDSDTVMEGPVFRRLDLFELNRIVPKLRVLARSSPHDKRKLVKFLKSQHEVVAVTGDGTNDAPALKLADVGFSMGIEGTEVAKEASEIILMDDNFSSIVKAIMWGRAVNDSVKKFLQFQLTVNITAVLLTFVSAVSNASNTSVLTAVELLWVNLIMDTFAALALATDSPNESILKRKPDGRKAPLISVTMWKMILGQAWLQLVITFILHFGGSHIWGFVHSDPHFDYETTQLNAMVFNTFVWLQFFNMFVSRRIDNNQNILEGVLKNKYFLVIASIIGGGQILIMYVGGAAFSVRRQTGPEWAVALICGFLSIPMGFFIRAVPDKWVIKIYPKRLVDSILHHTRLNRKRPSLAVDEESAIGYRFKWNPAIEQVRDQLVFIRKIKGGRLSQLKFKPKEIYHSWKESLSPASTPSISEASSSPTSTLASSHPQDLSYAGGSPFLTVPGNNNNGSRIRGSSIGALTMVPAIVGGAIGGWSPERQDVRQFFDDNN